MFAHNRQRIFALAPALLAWFKVAGRHTLPWQQHPNAYRVWVSEIMLQQTQVSTVQAYYQRFMQRFPTLQTLAAASLDEVLHLWTGLGYYARARNLHRAAQIIMQQQGMFPCTRAEVEQLPGIGRSTAGAILSLTYGQRHPILDGNVKRVLTRYFGITGFPGERTVANRLWQYAEQCTPHVEVAAYTQAIMDLGALVCTRTRPQCTTCPLASFCRACLEHRQHTLPTPRPKKAHPQQHAHVVVAINAVGALLLEQRPLNGIWGGLWTFPQFNTAQQARQWARAMLSARRNKRARTAVAIAHSFTHFDLLLQPHVWTDIEPAQALSAEYYWYDPNQPARIGLAKPVTTWLARQ